MVLAIGIVLSGGACSERPADIRVAPVAVAMPSTARAVEDPSYPVGLRVLRLHRGRLRPLPTLLFYPARPATQKWESAADAREGMGDADAASAKAPPEGTGGARATWGLLPAPGRFPLVLYSHGLSGSPQRVATTLAGWAAAGFVVAAPSYPYTHEHTRDYRRWDIVNQPDDARYVLRRLLRLAVTPAEPLAGHIDTDHIAAVGHSAGGYTTSGLFVKGHDPRLRAGVVLSGWRAPGAFAGPPARMLFLQGTADPVVPMAKSRAAYARVPWPKRYLILNGISHANYLRPGQPGYRLMDPVVLRFLRSTLTTAR
jgi:dienelactone hydrolase